MVNSQNINLAICIQVTFISKNKLQEKILFRKTRVFSKTDVSILNLCYDGNKHTYAMTKELKKTAFRINSQSTKQRVGIQVTFILEVKLKKKSFFGKIYPFFQRLAGPF